MERDLYERIVTVYQQTGPVDKTAEQCGTYAIKVRKVLITEGLWHSKKSDAVNTLRSRGYSVSEIAEALGMDEKNVQFYLPYTDHAITPGKSGSRERVQDFRDRGRKSEEGNLFREERKDSGQAEHTREVHKKEKKTGIQPASQNQRRIEAGDWSAYQLHIELVANNYLSEEEDALDIFRDEEDPGELRKLLKTRQGITRDVIVPGCMSLHQLSYVIQELFGFMNSHLHHFALPKALFRQLTGGTVSQWAELCGTILRVPVAEDFSDLYWDDDYKQGKSLKAWKRFKYIGEQMNYGVGETFMDSLRLLKEHMEWAERAMKQSKDHRKPEEIPLEDFRHKYAAEGEINAVLERLKVEDLFLKQGTDFQDPEEWRNEMRLEVDVSLSYLEAFRKTRSFRSLEDAMSTLRLMREDRDALDRAIWTRKEEIRESLGVNPDRVQEKTEAAIHRLERQIGKAMHAFDPEIWPLTDTLYYNYDYGDDWLFQITCKEIYFRAEEEFTPEGETETALREAEKRSGIRSLEMEQNLQDCGWGKNYMEEYTFVDYRCREVHNMLYLPLCECFLETKPVCIFAEGLPLVEDVGGIGGYFDFIRTIHGEDAQEAASLRTWARSLGWKEIVPKAGTLL